MNRQEPPQGPVIREDVYALVREYKRDPFGFELRTAFIETYAQYPGQWQDLFRREEP